MVGAVAVVQRGGEASRIRGMMKQRGRLAGGLGSGIGRPVSEGPEQLMIPPDQGGKSQKASISHNLIY